MTTRQVAIRVKTEGKAEVQRDMRDIGQAGSGAYEQIGRASDQANAAADRQMAKWKQMAAAAQNAEAIAQRQARFNTLLGVGQGSGISARDSAEAFVGGGQAGFSRMQRQMMVYTASDVFASAASGMSPALIAMQQGPQVLQSLAMEGDQAGKSLLRLIAIFTPLAAVVGVTTAAILVHSAEMRKLDVVAGGLGATANLTGAQLDALALAAAEAGDISTAAGRDMAATYLSTGRIGGEVMTRLIAMTKDYAVTTRQDAAAATAELATALADPAKGAEVLSQKLQFLDDATYRYVQTLVSQNRTTEAQIVILDSLSPKLLNAADNMGVLAGAAEEAKNFFVDMFDWYGRLIERMAGGGNVAEQISSLQQQMRWLEPAANNGNHIAAQKLVDLEAQRVKLTERWVEQQKDGFKASEAMANQVVADARPLISRYNPNPQRLLSLQGDRSRIQASIDTGTLTPAGLREAQAALAAVDKDIAAVKAGYSSAAAQATAFGRAARSSGKDAQEAAREAEQAARNAQRLSDLMLRDQLTLARLGDDKSLIFDLEMQTKLRARIAELQSAGVASAEAELRAQRQIGLELKAASDARIRTLADSPDLKGFTPTSETIARWKDMKIVYHEHEEAIRSLTTVGERGFDSLLNPQNWDDWRDAGRAAILDITNEFFRLAVANPLKNLLFSSLPGFSSATTFGGGGASGFLSGLFGKAVSGGGDLALGRTPDWRGVPADAGGWGGLASLFGKNADGTDHWRGGMTWVGERGPELINLPRGSQVFSNAESRLMGGAPPITIVLNAQGAGPNEVAALKAEVASLKRDLPSLVISVSNDARQRRQIRP